MEFLFAGQGASMEALLFLLGIGVFIAIFLYDGYLFLRKFLVVFFPRLGPKVEIQPSPDAPTVALPIMETAPIAVVNSSETIETITPEPQSQEVVIDDTIVEPTEEKQPTASSTSTLIELPETDSPVQESVSNQSGDIEPETRVTPVEGATNEDTHPEDAQEGEDEEYIVSTGIVTERPEDTLISENDELNEEEEDIEITQSIDMSSISEPVPTISESDAQASSDIQGEQSIETGEHSIELELAREEVLPDIVETPPAIEVGIPGSTEDSESTEKETIIDGDAFAQNMDISLPQSEEVKPEIEVSTQSSQPIATESTSQQKNHSETLFALINNIRTFIARGQTLEARGLIIQGLALDKDNRELNMMLAGLYEQDRHFEKAEYIYKDLALTYPTDIDILEKLGNILIIERRYEVAQEIYRKITSIGGETEGSLYILTHLSHELHQYESAYEYGKKYQKQWPNNPEILTIIAQSEIYLGKRQDAIQTLIKLKNLTPYNQEITDTIQKLMMEEELAGNFGEEK